MRIEPFRAVYPNFDYITSVDAFFDTVKEDYPEYRKAGFFTQTKEEALYVYEISRAGRKHTGIICCVDIQEYINGNIKKHENTLPAKEQEQMHLIISRNAIVKPVLITHPNVAALDDLMKAQKTSVQNFYSTCFSNGEAHQLWQVKDKVSIKTFQELFNKEIKHSFIADGHHRCSTTALLFDRMKEQGKEEGYNKLFVCYFPEDQLEVHDYNRVVEGLTDNSLSSFMAQLSTVCNIKLLKKARKPKRKFEITLFINKEWYALTWRKKVLKKYKDEKVLLDAQILDDLVLENILGMEDVRTDPRLKYVEGPKGIEALRLRTIKNENRIGFCLYPVELKDLMEIATLNKIMPPKSTWFEPRIKNGLAVLELLKLEKE